MSDEAPPANEQGTVFWEDLPTGTVIDLGSKVMTRAAILEFAGKYDPQPFHTDEEKAKKSLYGGLIASGWHTASVAMRLLYDGLLVRAASMGSPGIDKLRWLKPVRPGDTIHAAFEVTGARPSRSRPEMGIIHTRWKVTNQDGEVVMTMEGAGMYRRREGSEEGDPEG